MIKTTAQHWGTYENRDVYLFTIKNSSGAYVQLSNFGATWVAAVVSNLYGVLENVVLGYPDLLSYIEDTAYMGATIGRFANRIGGARFMLEGITYTIADNDHGNSNHGGPDGFHKKVFDHEISGDRLIFRLISPDGEGGYPGNLEFKVIYQWTDACELLVDYEAVSDKTTLANFTNHAYFNLSGRSDRVFDHSLIVYSEQLLEVGEDYIPTGKILPVGDLAFRGGPIGKKIVIGDDGIKGLNICYVLKKRSDAEQPGEIKPAARLAHAATGRVLEVRTSYPGMILYTGDYLNSMHDGHSGVRYRSFDGLCLECQYYPDSPNHAHFPEATLVAGDTCRQHIAFRFTQQYLT